jgi:hypothetical protein
MDQQIIKYKELINFGINWTCATAIGWIVGWNLIHADFVTKLYAALEGTNIPVSNMFFSFIKGGIVGLVIGFLQLLAIRERIHSVNRWLVINVTGWGIIFMLVTAANWSAYYICLHSSTGCLQNMDAIGLITYSFVVGILSGAIIGYFQSFGLEIHDVRKWIWSNVAGWSLPLITYSVLIFFAALLTQKMDIDIINLLLRITISATGVFAGWMTGRFIVYDDKNILLGEKD